MGYTTSESTATAAVTPVNNQPQQQTGHSQSHMPHAQPSMASSVLGAAQQMARTQASAATAAPMAATPQASAQAAAPAAAKAGPQIGDYTDFRLYLKDVYDFRRSTESTGLRAYSYSTFSAAADIKSPNYLKLIIEGRRNLSDDMITRFARALRFSKIECEEFRALVRYGQSTEPMERNQFLRELADLRARRAFESGAINQKSWDKVPGWIGWVIYAMSEQKNVTFDTENVQRLFRANAAPDEVREALRKLFASGELAANLETGEVTKNRDLIDSPQDLPVELIRKLQSELIYLGIESLFRDSPKDREFGAMTVAMTDEEFQAVRFELRQLRKRLQKDITVKRKATKGDRVYQMNVQLFPLTEKA